MNTKQQRDEFLSKLTGDEQKRQPQKGGFFPLPDFPEKIMDGNSCTDPEHNPPKYLHIPQGQGYKHICPKCGKVQIVIPPQLTF